MAQDKTKRTMTDPMLEGTGQPGELTDTPTVPSDVQDPSLLGTGQPGELYGTPTEPNPDFVKDMQGQQAQVDSLIKRAAEVEVGKNFSIWDIATDLGLEFNPFKKEDKQ
tara:strand:+ start:1256 stop:1582 length:327 start_codon:yes stop_codon:yes gene_type:complete